MSNLATDILLAELRARLTYILELMGEFNEISSALQDAGYGCPSYRDEFYGKPESSRSRASYERTNPPHMPKLYVDANVYGHYTLTDTGILDDVCFTEKRIGRTLGPLLMHSERQRLGAESNWTCFYCRKQGAPELGPDARPWHLDHPYPIARGGDDKLDNHVLSCATCNLKKHAQSAREFLASK